MADDMDLPGEDDDAVVDLPEDISDAVELDDGSALVELDSVGSVEDDPDFYANLAEDLPLDEMNDIVVELLDKIEKDKEARKKRDEQYEEGIRRTGLGNDAPGGAQFSGASRVVHPIMAESCVDFSASAIKELFPPNGPVRTKLIGDEDREKLDKARRKSDHMNWQLTEQVPEYRSELEQMLTQLPLGGSQYLKLCWNTEEDRPSAEAVFIDDVFLPFAAGNFYTAARVTHRQYFDQYQYTQKVKSGEWVDVDAEDATLEDPEQSKAAKANDKIEGRASSTYNEDGLREVYEVYTKLELSEDSYCDGSAPYVITIDASTERVLALYRNWEDGDDTYTKLDWLVEFQFIPWRGAYGIGLPHLIGGLSGALTGALRALLDSAHIANAATLLKLKGARMGGQTQEVAVTQVQEIEGPAGVDDIKKLAMPMPFNPPSPVLFQLLGWLDQAGKGVVSTSEEKIADASNSMPVGTAMALIEHGSKVYSSIHARLHRAQERALKILHRLNRMYLPEKVKFNEDTFITRDDYEGSMDVVPVSDPNIFSETQRFAQLQALAQRASVVPGLYNVAEVERRILEMMKIHDGDKLLASPPSPKKRNAANENVAMYLGQPVTAFPDQDHVAHLTTHLEFLRSPALGGQPTMGVAFQRACIEHVKQHVALFYATAIYQTATAALGQEASEVMKTPELSRDFDRLIAASSKPVIEVVESLAKGPMPVIEQAIANLQKNTPPTPMDPSHAALQVAQLNAQQKSQQAQGDQQLKAQQLQLAQQDQQHQQQMDQQSLAVEIGKLVAQLKADASAKEAELQTRMDINTQDNQTAMRITAAKIGADMLQGEPIHAGGLETGTGINPNPGV